MRVLGIDPGLVHTGFAFVELGKESEAQTGQITGVPDARTMAHEIVELIIDARVQPGTMAAEFRKEELLREPVPHVDAIAIEDFKWRPAKVHNGRQITTALDMARMLGRLDAMLEDAGVEVHWTLAKDSLRDQPFGAAAKRFGIPGRNDHERSAYYQALWLLGTLRLSR